MSDLLVKLYHLPDPGTHLAALSQKKILVRRPMSSEKIRVVEWVKNRFSDGWAAESDVAFARQPVACMIAVCRGQLAGFACYDSTCLNFFGPIGIDSAFRHQGIGRALLLVTLNAMAHAGYAYAIIGSAGPTGFFEKCAGAMAIPGSTPGIYQPPLNRIKPT